MHARFSAALSLPPCLDINAGALASRRVGTDATPTHIAAVAFTRQMLVVMREGDGRGRCEHPSDCRLHATAMQHCGILQALQVAQRQHLLVRHAGTPLEVEGGERRQPALSPGKRLHHQRSSRHAMVPLSDTSPHPGPQPAQVHHALRTARRQREAAERRHAPQLRRRTTGAVFTALRSTSVTLANNPSLPSIAASESRGCSR
jgi:hypothetical protein